MPLIDTHAHLDFYDDPLPILANGRAAGLSAMLAVGIGDGPATMHRALDLCRSLSTPELLLFASAGIHPSEAEHATLDALERVAELAEQPECIAIGEIGLDYYHVENPPIALQKEVFRAQMRLAAVAGKPILLHCRTSELATPAAKARFGPADAAHDLLTMLETEWAPTGLGGILHCFSGTIAHARRALAIGFYLSFAGNLTYPRSEGIREVARYAPANRILVETDSPFLSPIPLRGERNQPANVVHTAAFLAQLRGVTPDQLAHQTSANFQALFPATRPALATQ
jgi:TatD DNase family protein